MEGDPAYATAASGGKRSDRACSQEERKKRKTSGMAEVGQRRPSISHDDRSSAASGPDVADRLTYLEQRMQMQEDEIQLLKKALTDVLKRLNISEDHRGTAAAVRKAPGVKGPKTRPASVALPSRTSMVTSSVASLKKSTTMPYSCTARNYSPTPLKSAVKSPPGSVKDSPCKTTKPRPTSAALTCKKQHEGNKQKDPAVSLGIRRVTHCKVTMQICLSPLARKTGSSEGAKSGATVHIASRPVATPKNPQAKASSKPDARKTTPSFTLNFQKSTSSQNMTLQDTSSIKSPIKSPSQYFQICY